MTALSEKSGVVRYHVGPTRHHPMFDHSPARMRELMGRAVGGTHEDILAAKQQIVERRQAIHKARAHVAKGEHHLSRIGAQHVVACVSPGYADPQHRIDQAAADKAAGLPGPLTWEDGERIKRGEMAPPTWDHDRPMYSEIHAMKRHIAHHATLAEMAQTINDHVEAHLHTLDPQAVVAAKVPDYFDPPAIVARAKAQEAQS